MQPWSRPPLPLHDARPLPPLPGVNFAPGPAFIRRELGIGMIAFASGAAALLALRRLQNEPAALPVALSIAALAIVVLGPALAVRSFRNA